MAPKTHDDLYRERFRDASSEDIDAEEASVRRLLDRISFEYADREDTIHLLMRKLDILQGFKTEEFE